MIEQNRYTVTDKATKETKSLSLEKVKNFIYGKIYRDVDQIIKDLDNGLIFLIKDYKVELLKEETE